MAKIGEIRVDLTADPKPLDKGLKQGQQKLDNFGDKVNKIGGLLAGAFAVSKIKGFLDEASELAGVADGVSRAFQRLDNAPKLLDDLKEATKGTVSELKLMQAAINAKNFNVPLTKLATFFEFATRRAQETGQSVDFLVESIINGIGRKSILILDNLGISAAAVQEEMKLTGDFGAAAANIIERELGKSAEVVEDAKVQAEQLDAAWENFKVTLGRVFNEATSNLNPALKELTENVTNFLNALFGNPEAQALIDELNELEKKVEAAGDAYEATSGRMKKSGEGFFDAKTVITEIQIELEKMGIKIERVDGKWKQLAGTSGTVSTVVESNDKLKDTLAAVSLELETKYAPSVDLVTTAMMRALTTTKGLSQETEALINQYAEEFPNASEAVIEKLEKVNQVAEGVDNVFHGAINTLANLAASGEKNLGKLVQAGASAARDQIAQEIAIGVAGAVKGALKNVPFPFNLAAAVTAGAAATSLFNSIIPKFANGVTNFGGGAALVGERGPELVTLPRGANVIPNSSLGGMSGSLRIQLDSFVIPGGHLRLALKNYELRATR